MKKWIILVLPIILLCGVRASAKNLNYGVKEDIKEKNAAAIQTIDDSRRPSSNKHHGPVPRVLYNTTSPALLNTKNPQWIAPKNEGISCNLDYMGTANNGKQCTSSILSF